MSIFSQGDIIEVNFDPTVGHEPAKRRPALVVSTHAFNLRSSMTFVAPITSVVNNYPLHVVFDDEESGVRGAVCVEQIRAVDLEARPCTKVGVLGIDEMDEVLNRLAPIFGL